MGMSLDDLASNATSAAGAARRRQITLLPEPEPRERRVHGDLGRRPRRRAARRVRRPLPAAVRRRGAARRRHRRRRRGVAVAAASCCRTSASTRSSGRPSSEYGFEPTRFDEMRRGAWDVHARVADMDINGVWASLCFPSFLPGFVGQRLTMWPDDDELALGRDARVQRLAPRRVVRRASRPLRPEPDRVPARPGRWRPTRSAATRRAASRRSRSRRRPTSSACRRSTPATGTRSSRRARRPRPCCACTSARRARRRRRRPTRRPRDRGPVRRVRHVRRGRLALLEDAGALPQHQICLSEGGIGWVAGHHRPARPLLRYQLGYLPTWRDVDVDRARCCGATSGSARSTTTSGFSRRDVSASSTSSSSPTTRTPTPRGPTRSRPRGAPRRPLGRRPAQICWQNAVELFRHPAPAHPLP